MAVVVKRSQRQPDEAEHVPRGKGAAAALSGLQLDRAPFDHNKCVPPFGLLVRPDAARWDRNQTELERRGERLAQK